MARAGSPRPGRGPPRWPIEPTRIPWINLVAAVAPWRIGPFSNRTIYLGVATVLAAQALVIDAPLLQAIFGSPPLGGADLLTALGVGFLIMPLIGLEKWLNRRRARRASSRP